MSDEREREGGGGRRVVSPLVPWPRQPIVGTVLPPDVPWKGAIGEIAASRGKLTGRTC